MSEPNLTTRLAVAELEAHNLVKKTCPRLSAGERENVVRKIMKTMRPTLIAWEKNHPAAAPQRS